MTNDDTADRQRTDSTTDGAATDDSERTWTTSRRRVLGIAAATGVATGIGGFNFGQQSTSIRLVGRTSGWEYEGDLDAPYIGGGEAENPTLQLQAGTEYEVTWENADGAAHNFVIRDDQGEDLVRTEIISEQGATQTVSFTAEEGMATYLCEVHPNTMVGDIQLGGEQTPTETPTDAAGFFQQGTTVGYESVAEGLTAPTDFDAPDDDSGRFFVADQTGELWLVTDEGRQDEPVVDISDRMVELGSFNGSYASQGQDYDERGLLGVECHPEFADNGRLYLHYSAPPNDETPEGWDHVEVVSEFTADDDGATVDPDSERVLLEFQSPQYNHDAGPIAFGPDGYLYVPMGDGGGANDDMYGHVDDWYDQNTGGNGQDIVENLLGDIVRIDVDNEGEETPYGIPEDNPFVDTEARDEIYAYGFRNPFGISFDSQGNLFVADAGQNLFEEANVVERGGNYGWNVMEGTHCFSTENPSEVGAIADCPMAAPDEAPYGGAELQPPIVEYPHSYQGESVGIVIIGGHRYETDTIPGLEGKYVFGEWTTDPTRAEPQGRVFAATPPEGFDDAGTGTETETETQTGTETGAGTDDGMETDDDAKGCPEDETGTDGAGTEYDTDTETAADGGVDAETETPTETAATGTPGTETETPGTGTETETGTEDGGEIGPGDIPLDELWEMEELVFESEFDYFVRQFGRDQDGEIYVLVSRQGVPQGDTGEVLKLVPPGAGETPDGTETADATPSDETETEATETPSDGTETQGDTTETPTDY